MSHEHDDGPHRPRWPDARLDDMHTDLEDLEDQVRALRLLPERVKGLREVVQTQSEALEAQAQRTTDLRRDVQLVQRRLLEMDRKLDERFERVEMRANGVDPDTNEPQPLPFRPDFLFWIKLAGVSITSVAVPVVVAILSGS